MSFLENHISNKDSAVYKVWWASEGETWRPETGTLEAAIEKTDDGTRADRAPDDCTIMAAVASPCDRQESLQR